MPSPATSTRYRDLDRFTDLIKRALQTVPQVSKVTRAGLLPEQIYLEYSQERLASYGLQLSKLSDILRARNITIPGGLLDVRGKRVAVDPSGEFTSETQIGDVIVSTTAEGRPIYLRDGVDVIRAYQTPARYLNYYQERGADGQFHRIARHHARRADAPGRADRDVRPVGGCRARRPAEDRLCRPT